MKFREIIQLAGDIALCEGVGVAGGLFTAGSVNSEWYANLRKPGFQPPGAIFGPVWTLLYALMGVALFLVQKKKSGGKAPLYRAFAVQLVLNLLWTLLFFGLRRPWAAFVEIIALWAAIVVTTVLFWRVSRWAAILLMPYLAWTSFATLLTGALWRLNSR